MKKTTRQAQAFGNFVTQEPSALQEILDYIWDKTHNWWLFSNTAQAPPTYVYKVKCPSCNQTECDLFDDNSFRCAKCGHEFRFPEPIEIKRKKDVPVGDVAMLIFSATQDWSGVRKGETLSTVWERLNQEAEVWYAVKKPEDFSFSSQAQTAEAEHVLLVLSNVRNYKVFQQETLSRLAVERVLEENKENAVIERFARLSADDIATLDDDWSKP